MSPLAPPLAIVAFFHFSAVELYISASPFAGSVINTSVKSFNDATNCSGSELLLPVPSRLIAYNPVAVIFAPIYPCSSTKYNPSS